MKKIKNISFALVMTPLLFTGCMQEKVSTIAPSKSIEKSRTLLSKVKNISSTTDKENNTSTNKSINKHVFNNVTPQQNTPNSIEAFALASPINQNIDDLEQLALMIQNNMDMDITGIEGSFTETIEVGNDWSELTKEDELIETAKGLIGLKYVWAANGPECFDCSGFTKYVFKAQGVSLPRYSGHQAKVGTKVNYDELIKGDLVFFDTEKKYKGKVNHVGIYIGNHQFIHASSAKKKVIITSFVKKRFYKNRFLWGQRVVNGNETYASL